MLETKINILLLDDNPIFFSKVFGDVVLPKKYRNYFQLYWLQTPAEASWLLDVYDDINVKSPEDLLELGLPPEILIFDYALSSPKDLKLEGQSSNIIDKLKAYVDKNKINVSIIKEYEKSVPTTGVNQGSDRMGCYIGGTFARAFSHYPCAAVPTTAHISTDNSDAAFFEWLSRKYLKGVSKHKTRLAPKWEDLINYGLCLFRERVVELINSNLIRIPLRDLQLILQNPIEAKESHISIYSRLGCKKIPLEGLFIDVSEDISKYKEVAKKWAEEIQNGLFHLHSYSDFSDARIISDNYYKASLSSMSSLRYELSDLLAKGSRNEKDKNRINELCKRFDIDSGAVVNNPHNVVVKNDVLGLWKNKTNKNDHVARWAALMLMIRTEQFYRQWLPDFDAVKSCEDEGEISYEKLAYKYGEKEADRLIKSTGLMMLEKSNSYEILGARLISVEDVFNFLDPLPDNVLTFHQKGKNFKKDTTTITNALKRLGAKLATKKNYSLELNVNSVLTEQAEGGLLQGEGMLLRLYADEIEYDEKGWPVWLKAAP